MTAVKSTTLKNCLFLSVAVAAMTFSNVAFTDTQRIYRFTNGSDFWYTARYSEGSVKIGYLFDRASFAVFRETPPGVHVRPLYQCLLNFVNAHFLSNDVRCEGHIIERHLGYMSLQQLGGMVPLSRCESLRIPGSYLTTFDRFECAVRGMRYLGDLSGLAFR